MTSYSYSYGYVRVSTMDQDPAGQLDAMAAAGVERDRVFVEYASGGRDDRHPVRRPRPVWKATRAGR